MKPSTIALILAAILAVGASFVLGYRFGRNGKSAPAGSPDTVYVAKWVRDSAKVQSSGIIATVPVFLPLFVPDTTEVHDTTTIRDSVLVEVPITEKHYASENYRATIRGYQAELTDIWIKQKETFVSVPYRKRWSFTVGPQVGFGITPQGWQPYAGAGVTFGYSF